MRATFALRGLAVLVFVGGIVGAVVAPIADPPCSILQEGACPSNAGWRVLIGVAGAAVALALWFIAFQRDRREWRLSAGLEP
jgi:hypothetical protein